MSWWNKHRNKISLLLIVCISIGFLTTIGLVIFGPLIGTTFCTMAGCLGGGVHINFVGKIPEQYVVKVDFPYGTRELHCNTNSLPQNRTWDKDECTDLGVFFADSDHDDIEPPKELTITIEYDGEIISRKVQPEYRDVFRPNGENCPPVCYYATIEFEIPN